MTMAKKVIVLQHHYGYLGLESLECTVSRVWLKPSIWLTVLIKWS